MASDSEFTLPDYLRPGLAIVFVGINPGAYSSKVGKYFATPQNRFWPALNRSGIANASRPLVPGDEAWLHEAGIGFTDVVKRASSSASDLRAADFRTWAPLVKRKLEQAAPLVVCFNGLTGYRWYMQYAEGGKVKGIVHWVSAMHAVDAEVHRYGNLFAKEDPEDVEEGGHWRDNLNPSSLEVLTSCKLEPALGGATPGARFQFERLGYYCRDTESAGLVFNRTVTLRDTWAKIQKKG